LDFLQERQVIKFAEDIRRQSPQAVVITGDISVASGLVLHLSILERVLQVPINFVLGNHDYYGNYVDAVRQQMRELSNMSGFLKYLPTTPYVTLSAGTALVGHDGWYDALFGDAKNSRFVMLDWTKIGDFVDANAMQNGMPILSNIIPKSRELALVGVQHVHDGIKAATRYHKNIIVATHYPPFEEAHMHEGRIGDASAQPWYTSKMMGDMLRSAAQAFPDVNFTVLAGHTHGKFSGQIEKNLICHVGHSEYGSPSIADVLEVA
jgi:predicted phosphohydrolase